VDHRDPKNAHDRVADKFLHYPTMALDNRSRLSEEAAHYLPDGLRIEAFPKRGGA
jgi:hypothetical protein